MSLEKDQTPTSTPPRRFSNIRIALGVLLALAAINNMLVRVDIILNTSVTVMLVIGSYGVLRKKEWGPSLGSALSLITLLFSTYEAVMFYYVYPAVFNYSAQELLALTMRYLIPLDVICVTAFALSRRVQKSSVTMQTKRS